MRRAPFFRSTLLLLLLTLAVVPVTGCGSDAPESGTQGTPVDAQQAASQQQAYSNFAKTKQAGGK